MIEKKTVCVRVLKLLLRPALRRAVDSLPPRWHVTMDFVRRHHYWPHLDEPRMFNEKIAWRKLYDRDPLMLQYSDKVQAKKLVAERFGPQYIIPTLAVYDSASELDFDVPPLSVPPYVIKTNHGSGYNVFVMKKPDDSEAIRARLAAMLKKDYAEIKEEWAHSKMARKILVEPFAPECRLRDYKFHVFRGKVFAVEVIIDRFSGYHINFLDRDWRPLDIRAYAERPRFEGDVQKPVTFPEMIRFAESLGEKFSYVRVDVYEIEGQVKFGEATFYPGSGQDRFEPRSWDYTFGQQWKQDWSFRAEAKRYACRPAEDQSATR